MRLPLSGLFSGLLSGLLCAPPPGGIPDEASSESMLGIVVLRGVELVVPLDRACESPGEGVSVALLGGCSCFTAPLVTDGGAPWGPLLGDGVERCPFGG